MPIGINGSGTITGLSAGGLPDGTVTTDDIASAAVTPAKLSQPLTLETAKATTSGTSIDFTGIPSWARRITVMFNAVSTNGSSPIEIRLGTASGIDSTGYAGSISGLGNGGLNANASTTGFPVVSSANANSGNVISGSLVLVTQNTNVWVCTGITALTNDNIGMLQRGIKTTSSTLDRIRLTTVNGTDTFDAGSVNIMYEG